MMEPQLTYARAVLIVDQDATEVISGINDFTSVTFRTRGGRLGSGMGSLLEALWVYYTNRVLYNEGGLARACELAWLPDHEPADFACLHRGMEWKPESREGELFRIEAKSMNVGVDEAKGHFTNLEKETSEFDQLLVLIWSWASWKIITPGREYMTTLSEILFPLSSSGTRCTSQEVGVSWPPMSARTAAPLMYVRISASP